ncbi:NYN domain-containing protein [Candidatus Saccharibacteria bacterium]|nr:NYN domain-containing protein [Candidatus Saccharibacteria bacterium]
MTKQPVTYAFIDGENLFKSFKAMGYKNVDYVKLYWWLRNKKNVKKVFLYVGLVEGDSQRENKYNGLAKLGYEMKIKPVQVYDGKIIEIGCECPKCKNEFIHEHKMNDKSKANCDAELTVDVTRLCITDKCDDIIVFSGDGDFAYLYEFVVSELRKKVRVFSPLKYPASLNTSGKLKDLDKEGCIDLINLESVAQHRAILY